MPLTCVNMTMETIGKVDIAYVYNTHGCQARSEANVSLWINSREDESEMRWRVHLPPHVKKPKKLVLPDQALETVAAKVRCSLEGSPDLDASC